MWAEIGTKIGRKITATAVVLSVGAAVIVGVGAASADGGDTSTCSFNNASYAAGTRLTVDGTTYICQNGQWVQAPERADTPPPSYTPPITYTPVTGLQEEYHPTSHTNLKFQSMIQAQTHHFP